MSGVNYYQLLGIRATATDCEIRRAYLRLSLLYHPDKRRTPDADADDLYRRIQEAYETLSCPEKRCLYDFVGCFAALTEVTFSASVQDVVEQHRSAVATDSSRAFSSRSSSGETLHSWGTSSAASRQSPCPSSDLSSSPGAATGSSGSDYGHHACCLSALCSEPPTGTCSSGGGDRDGGRRSSSTDASLGHEAGPRPAKAAGAAALLPPRPSCTQACHPLPFPPELKLPTAVKPQGSLSPVSGGNPNAAAASGGRCGATSPVTSPGTLLGKRRSPRADDARLHLFPPPQLHAQSPGGGVNAGAASSTISCPSPGGARRSHSADVHHRLLLTLEEMYSGCVKQLRLARRVYRPAAGLPSSPPGVQLEATSGGLLHQHQHQHQQLLPLGDCSCVEELFRVVVQPGWREGTKVTFPGKGDELPCGSRGDMVLVVAQAAHRRYERRGNDLHTVAVVPLVDALTGGDTAITTLDGRTLVLQLGPTCLQPFSECVVKGEGMPIPPGKATRGARASGSAVVGGATAPAVAAEPIPPAAAARGDLHVRFEVSFPADLTPAQKAELRRALVQ